jgi:hypothetical protein
MRTANYPRIEDPHDSLTGSLQAKGVESFNEFGGRETGNPSRSGVIVMARPNKPPKRLFRTEDRVSSFEHDRLKSPGKRMKVMSRDHEDVLQNIEFAVVTQFREDRGIDDRHVDEALTVTIENGEPSDRRVDDLVYAIDQMRLLREDVSDDVWRTALLTVRDSVRRHSGRRPRETSYLDFVSPYVG